jgi:hypothetical protein
MITDCHAKARQALAAGLYHQGPSGGVAFPELRLTGRIFHTAQTIGKPSKKWAFGKQETVDEPVKKNYQRLKKKTKQKAEKAEYG